jgi:hypothetical protein
MWLQPVVPPMTVSVSLMRGSERSKPAAVSVPGLAMVSVEPRSSTASTCNRVCVCQRLQPYASEAATPRTPRLQPYALQIAQHGLHLGGRRLALRPERHASDQEAGARQAARGQQPHPCASLDG